MKIRPLNDKLIVERQEVENKSEGGNRFNFSVG